MNSAHRDLLRHGSEALYDETVRRWDAFARNPILSTIDEFRQHLEKSEARTRASWRSRAASGRRCARSAMHCATCRAP